MPELAEVIETVNKELGRIGTDAKALKDSLGRDLQELRSKTEIAGAKLDANDTEIKALKESTLKKHEALEAKTQTLENTVGSLTEQLEKLSTSLKRPGFGGMGEDAVKRLAELLHFKTSALAIKGELRHTTDVQALAKMEELESYEKSFKLLLRRDKELLDHDVHKALSVGIDPDGGFLVTPAMSSRIITRIRETSPIRQFATIETISTDRLELARDLDDIEDGWVGETSDRPETGTPQVGTLQIPVHEQFSQPKATQKLLEDASVNVESWLAGKLADRFARKEATAFVTGNGINKPRGLLSYDTSTARDDTRGWGVFQHIISGHATLLTADALLRLPMELKEGYQASARWLMNRLTVQEIMLLKDGEGRYLWQPSLTQGQPSSLAGFPVSMATDMPVLGAGSLSVAFGDIGRTYTIVDRLGITTLRDPFTAKPHVKFYSRRRVGGDCVHFETMKFIKTAAA